jgi:carbonic anhydrase
MATRRIVAKASGGQIGPGWNLILLHHNDCGITRLVHSSELLAKHFGAIDKVLSEAKKPL